jgi:hypothetical protein
MNSTLSYQINTDMDTLYIVAKVEGLMLGYAGPFSWEQARRGNIAELAANLISGDLPAGQYTEWTFRTSGPYWSDKLGWCDIEDFVALHAGQNVLFSGGNMHLVKFDLDVPGGLEIVANARIKGYAGYK